MKILESSYDKGYSTITIQTASGVFTGHANAHPEDKCVESRIVGWKIAEQRAIIKYYKDKIKKEKNILKGIYEITELPQIYGNIDEVVRIEEQHENQIKNWENQIKEAKKYLEEIFNNIQKTKMVIKRKEENK